MKKRLLAVLLALVMVLALLPGSAFAADASLPDWYFLIAIFKNVDADYQNDGAEKHTKYTMTQDEIDLTGQDIVRFENYMDQVGVMRAHVDVVEIDTTITELSDSDYGSYLSAGDAAPLLQENNIDLDQYDHVTCVISLNDLGEYWGLGGTSYENGTGHACVNLGTRDFLTDLHGWDTFPESVYVHEFLHFMENMNAKWGAEFDLHGVRLNSYNRNDKEKDCYTDIILNRAKGSDGTGVHPVVWQYPPHVLRTISELSIPTGITGIGNQAFYGCTGLTNVTIPAGVTGIGDHAFYGCTALTSVTIPAGVTSIGTSAFDDCTSLTGVAIPNSVTSIGYGAFSGCVNLASASISTGITSIEGAVFYDCTSLTSVSIPSGVTSIGDHALRNCTALEQIFIPASVAEVGYAAFYNAGLKDVYYGGTREQWKAIALDEFNDPLTSATVHYNSAAPSVPSAAANPTNDNLTINGAAATPAAYKINDENYFKLRDLAALLSGTESQFSVDWDDAAQSIAMTTGQPYEKLPTDLQGKPTVSSAANLSGDALYVNGTKTDLTVYKVNGNNYFRLRDLGTLLDFYVGYENGTIVIDTSMPYSK